MARPAQLEQDLDQAIVDLASATVRDLFAQHGITDPNQAKRLARERFTEAELHRYRLARQVLDGTGAIG